MSAAYMRMFWGDFLKNTMHLTSAEVGVYVLLIAHYFEQGNLPDDDKRLARIARMPAPNWRKIRPIMEDFFEPGWRHARIDAEIEESRRKSDRGAKNARARWNLATMTPIPDTTHGKIFDESVTGQILMKSMDSLCDSIATASIPQCSSESESESIDTTLHTRTRLDDLEGRLREAGGLTNAPAPGLFVVGPIMACITGGCDLELDVLPTIRARTHARVSSWKFFVEAIWEAKVNREAAGMARAIPQAAPNCQAPLEKNWRPSAELVDYGKTLGLSQADIDWTAEGLRNWAGGKARDDWPGLFKTWLVRKAEKDGKAAPSASRMIDPQMDPMKRATEFYLKKAEKAG